MAFPEITMATETIHNPAEPRHFMRFKPVERHIRILRNGTVLAQTDRAMRMTEIARDVYDSVTYVPQADISPALKPMPDKSTHCPLKGDANYFTLDGNEAIAWTYDQPLKFAAELKGYVAFYPDQVTLEESGSKIGPSESE